MKYETYSDIVALWPRVSDFARDMGVGYQTARKMKERDGIHPAYWRRLVSKASERGFDGVTVETLVGLAERRLATTAATQFSSAEA